MDEWTSYLQTIIKPELVVKGVSDGGWFLFNRTFDNYDSTPTDEVGWLLDWAHTETYLNQACVQSDTTSDLLCHFGEFVWEYIAQNEQLFVVQQLFDKSHAAAEGFNDLNELPADQITDSFPFIDALLYEEQLIGLPKFAFTSDCRYCILSPLIIQQHKCKYFLFSFEDSYSTVPIISPNSRPLSTHQDTVLE